jgi:hypothetical protein
MKKNKLGKKYYYVERKLKDIKKKIGLKKNYPQSSSKMGMRNLKNRKNER